MVLVNPFLRFTNPAFSLLNSSNLRARVWMTSEASKQGVTTFVWRPGRQHDVAAAASADNVLASDCRAQFGRPSTESDSTVAGPATQRDNVLASKCEYPHFRPPSINLPKGNYHINTIRKEIISNENQWTLSRFYYRNRKANYIPLDFHSHLLSYIRHLKHAQATVAGHTYETYLSLSLS